VLITKLPFNLSPKLVYTVLTIAVAWLLAHYAIDLPDELDAAIPLVLGSLVGYQAPAGEAITHESDVASDDMLSPDALERIKNPIEPTPGMAPDSES
jgi:hypothetical protein